MYKYNKRDNQTLDPIELNTEQWIGIVENVLIVYIPSVSRKQIVEFIHSTGLLL
jgi:hypothetical protein